MSTDQQTATPADEAPQGAGEQDAAPEAAAGPAGPGDEQPAAEVPTAEERIATLERALEDARREAEAARDASLRAMAEADNVRKRASRDLENAHKFALERFVAELLPVKDSMELGLAADGADAAQLREGMQMTLRMLGAAVEKFGVTEVNPDGEPFDPQVHQAMSTREVPGVAAGTVVQVVQKGYLLNDRLVRPALVIVSK